MTQRPEHRPTHEETLSASRLLREWSRTLRVWSVRARQRSERIRAPELGSWGADLASRRAAPPSQPPAEAARPDPGERAGGDELRMGEIQVADLFVILVQNHGFEVREAVRQLMIGMLAAGYPAENETVSATDAMDILEGILGEGRD